MYEMKRTRGKGKRKYIYQNLDCTESDIEEYMKIYHSTREEAEVSKFGNNMVDIIDNLVQLSEEKLVPKLSTYELTISYPDRINRHMLVEIKSDLIPESNIYKNVIEFLLIPMPNCCGILISSRTRIPESLRGKGISYILQDMKNLIANKLGYTILFATCTLKNKAEVQCLRKSGWQMIDEFINKRTNNNLGIWTKRVN
jgi:predicted GNAT family acetyltransferase